MVAGGRTKIKGKGGETMPAFQSVRGRHNLRIDCSNHKWVKVGLVRGRHNMPVDSYIFDEIANPADISAMNRHAREWCWYLTDEDEQYDQIHIIIYVTGLTAALIAVLNAIKRYASENKLNVSVVLKHYDTVAQLYRDQEVIL